MLSEIFKAYDVRGIYKQNLTEEIAYKIGRAFVYFLKCKDVVIGIDMRLSSPKLSKAFMNGVIEQGVNAIFIGEVCTDAVYFASGFLRKPAVMFTASHNPKQYNGMKFCREDAIPINYNTGLQKIKSIIEKKQYQKSKIKKFGKTIKKDVLKNYVAHVRKFIDVKRLRKLKIAVDAGNGMAGKIVPLAYKNLTIKIIPLYFKLDGTFPNHPADPSKSENLTELQKTVKEKKCDFGIGFDGDADRIFFVDENGETINSSLISALIIKNILLKKKSNASELVAGERVSSRASHVDACENASHARVQLTRTRSQLYEKIIYNLVCSHIVPETIKKYYGIPMLERVGHSFIKETMRKTKALFACEHSAHYYYRDNYRADSGIITSLIVSEIVSIENRSLSELLDEFRKYHTIEETSVEVKNKEAKLKEIKSIYKKQNPNKISKLDGVSVEFDEWWFNVRPSNTEPLLRLNLEANSEELMKEKRDELVRLLKN